jgi:hypothetical protein
MTAAELLNELEMAGATVEVDGDSLRVRAPKGTVTPVIQEELARNKLLILALLTDAHSSTVTGVCLDCAAAAEMRYGRCSRCWALIGLMDTCPEHSQAYMWRRQVDSEWWCGLCIPPLCEAVVVYHDGAECWPQMLDSAGRTAA